MASRTLVTAMAPSFMSFPLAAVRMMVFSATPICVMVSSVRTLEWVHPRRKRYSRLATASVTFIFLLIVSTESLGSTALLVADCVCVFVGIVEVGDEASPLDDMFFLFFFFFFLPCSYLCFLCFLCFYVRVVTSSWYRMSGITTS